MERGYEKPKLNLAFGPVGAAGGGERLEVVDAASQ